MKMIEVDGGDAVLVFREDGSQEMTIPPANEGAEIYRDSPTWRAMLCVMAINDKDVRAIAEKKMTE